MKNKVAIDTVRLDVETRNHLLTLKRRTAIEQWNVLARWALCVSLADKAPLRKRPETGLGAIEMTWKTFAGENDDIYLSLVIQRCRSSGAEITRESVNAELRGHIARGAARLVGIRTTKSIAALVSSACA